MNPSISPITDIVLDFDGTCTQIPFIYKEYLERYLIDLNKKVFLRKPVSPNEWLDAQQQVRNNSPKAAWAINHTPAAPAAADPYILAFETTKAIIRDRIKKNEDVGGINEPPSEIHSAASDANQAPWRIEAREIFEALLKKNINIHFVSNSSSLKITQRLQDLLGVSTLPKGISIESNATKFRICELNWYLSDLTNELKLQFENLPAVYSPVNIGRPVYLHRGFYFETICKVFKNDLSKLAETVFCGDIWEMDLAMPFALGANIHLLERAAPFETYPYEREAVTAAKGKIGNDLLDLLKWF